MSKKFLSSVAFAALCAVALATSPAARADELITNGPQASRGDYGGWSATRNVIESQRYDALVATNPGFRHARMRKECGPINDPQLRADCLASFEQPGAPMYGSSAPPQRYRQNRDLGE